MYFKSHAVRALIVSLLVDRAFAFGPANLEDKHSFIGPGTGFEKGLVGFGVHKDVVEHVMVSRLRTRAIAHIETRRQINPLAVVFRKPELAVSGIFRTGSGRGLAASYSAKKNRRHDQ